MYESLSRYGKIIVNSITNTNISGWLEAIPTTPELSIRGSTMVVALRLFLGIPFFKVVNLCFYCGKTFEDYNQHTPICGTEKAITHRHNALKCIREKSLHCH